MYKPPVSIMETAVRKIVEERDNEIICKIQSALGVDVDKGELIRALQYDRNQYEKGYADGKADAMAELVRCKDCRFCRKHPTSGKVKLCTNEQWNTEYYPFVHDDGFCCFGERKDDA